MQIQTKLFFQTKPFLAMTFIFFSALTGHSYATTLWQDIETLAKPQNNLSPRVHALNPRNLRMNTAQLDAQFSEVTTPQIISLPLPDGTSVSIALEPSPILSKALARQYPSFMTYRASQKGQPQNIGRFSISHLGLFGLFRYNNQWMMLSPMYQSSTQEYASYWYKDAPTEPNSKALTADFLLMNSAPAKPQLAQKIAEAGDTIRTYKLAMSTTAEYSQRLGGSTAGVVAELMNLVNRINQILLIDLALQFELIDNQDIIFFDTNTDPFTNADAASDIETNQTVIDDAIGNQNYDIGHLLGTNGGGLAYVGVVCNNNFKAQGYSGISNPRGERFYIDLVAHELGHQLGASHSFNASISGSCADGRSGNFAYEPGSGSTIMAYAGICNSQDIQNMSDPYFHAISIQNIRDYVEGFSGQSCGIDLDNNNAIPQIQLARTAYTIPANTPFVLNGTATDTDKDPLTFNWEQFDNGGALGATNNLSELNTDNGHNPLFRSFSPVSRPQRYFPRMSDVLAGKTILGETYPSTDRDMRFRLTIRDNKGGVDQQDVSVTVTTAVQTFNLDTPQLWTGFSQQLISWDLGDTKLEPVNCENVALFLDTDNDNEFEITLASATPNDGEHIIQVPNIASENARMMLKCSDNIFYTVTEQDFMIVAAQPIAPTIDSQNPISFLEDAQIEISLDDLNVSDSDSVYPDDFTLTIIEGDNYTINQQTLIPNVNFNGVLVVGILVSDGVLQSNVFPVAVQVTAVNDQPVANNDSLTIQQNSSLVTIDVLANDQDADNDTLEILAFSYSGQGRVTIENSQLTYIPANGFSGSESLSYVVTDGELSDQATLDIEVNASTNSVNNAKGGSLYLLSLLSFLCFSARVGFRLLCKGNYD